MNLEKFRQANLERPKDKVPCPELVGTLFDKEEEAFLLVRGLTANELYLCRESRDKNTVKSALQSAIGNSSELAEVFKRALGQHTDATAAETAFRIEAVVFGVVGSDGKSLFDYADAVRLADHFPNAFMTVSGKIVELSGEASVTGEK